MLHSECTGLIYSHGWTSLIFFLPVQKNTTYLRNITLSRDLGSAAESVTKSEKKLQSSYTRQAAQLPTKCLTNLRLSV